MSFTDKDLRRLKEEVGDFDYYEGPIKGLIDRLKAAEKMEIALERLIDRLEAAEKMEIALEHCRNRPHEHNPMPDFTMTQCEVIDRALAEWRKAAGR